MFHLMVRYKELRFRSETPEDGELDGRLNQAPGSGRIVVLSPSPGSTNLVDENQRFEDCREALSVLQET